MNSIFSDIEKRLASGFFRRYGSFPVFNITGCILRNSQILLWFPHNCWSRFLHIVSSKRCTPVLCRSCLWRWYNIQFSGVWILPALLLFTLHWLFLGLFLKCRNLGIDFLTSLRVIIAVFEVCIHNIPCLKESSFLAFGQLTDNFNYIFHSNRRMNLLTWIRVLFYSRVR